MGKTIRRLSDAREASVCLVYVPVSLLTFFLSLSLFLVVLVHISSLSVHVYSRFFFPLDCFSLVLSFFSLLVPPFPFKNVLHSTLVAHPFSHLPLSPPFSRQYLTFWCLFDFRSFILSDSPLCYQIRHDLLALQTNLSVC
jgi:hypothetical protein